MHVVAVAGISSNVGKTTLVCDLIRRLPGWEAVKVTKGHYRSCGKDPHACCVSHLLSEKPLVMSERRQTDVAGKDTGRYWEAGASAVHWVVATKDGVLEGVREALTRVAHDAPGVLVEGTGFLISVEVDVSILALGRQPREVKASALKVLSRIDYLYAGQASAIRDFEDLLARKGVSMPQLQVVLEGDLDAVVEAASRRTAPRHQDTKTPS